MSPKLKKLLTYFFFLGLSLGVIIYVFDKVDIKTVLDELKDVQWVWVLLVLLISLIGHVIRAARWKQLLVESGVKSKLNDVFVALIAGYFVNLGIPRLGEITRCLSLKKSSNAPLPTSIGTVITERIIDVLTLLILFVGVTWAQHTRLSSVFDHYVGVHLHRIWIAVMTDKHLILSLATLVVIVMIVLLLLKKRIQKTLNTVQKINVFARFKSGLLSIVHVQHLGLFLLFTALIWCSYFLTSYVCFFALPQTSHLSIGAGLAVTVYGSISRSLPAAGGSVGIFHVLVAAVLVLFGIPESQGLALAVIIHGTQLLFYLLTGAYAGIVLVLSKPVNQDDTSIQYAHSKEADG